jgi:hypothetical protein
MRTLHVARRHRRSGGFGSGAVAGAPGRANARRKGDAEPKETRAPPFEFWLHALAPCPSLLPDLSRGRPDTEDETKVFWLACRAWLLPGLRLDGDVLSSARGRRSRPCLAPTVRAELNGRTGEGCIGVLGTLPLCHVLLSARGIVTPGKRVMGDMMSSSAPGVRGISKLVRSRGVSAIPRSEMDDGFMRICDQPDVRKLLGPVVCAVGVTISWLE